jgi:hypothetical protein
MSIRSALFILGILVGGAVLFVIGAFATIILLTAPQRSDFSSHSAAACGEVCRLAGMVAEYATPPTEISVRFRTEPRNSQSSCAYGCSGRRSSGESQPEGQSGRAMAAHARQRRVALYRNGSRLAR